MFDHILVPLDGSRFSESVLPFTARLAWALKSDVVLVHVIELDRHLPKPPPADHMLAAAHTAALDHFKESAQAAASAYLEKHAQSLQEQGISVSSKVMYGHPAEAITSLADEEKAASTVVMATHTRSDVGRHVLGSVADEILRAIRSPVFLLQPDHELATDLRQIVAPLDGSQEAGRIISYMASLAKGLRLPVHSLQVIQRLPEVYDAHTHVYHASLLQGIDEFAERYLQDVAGRLNKDSIECECHVLKGDPASAILEYAEGHPGSLIAVTTRGGATTRGLGKVAYRVIQSSRWPLLVLPSPQPGPEWRVEDTNA